MTKKCIVCQSEKKLLGRQGGFIIEVCSNCGLGETKGKSKIAYYDYYRDNDYKVNEDQFRNIFQKRVELVMKFKKSGKVLEVGSSTGLLLSLLREKGFNVQGIEPSKKAAFSAENDKNIPTLVTTFEKAKLKNNDFDVVIFNHTLEHIQNIKRALEKTYNILKGSGIVLIDVPNFGSFSAKIRRQDWKYLLPAEHKWHFSKESLARLLKQVGFNIIYSETRSGIWDYQNPIQEIFESFIGFKKRFIMNILIFAPSFFLNKFGLGSSLTIVGKKAK